MSTTEVSLITLAVTLGGVLAGQLLRLVVPEVHLLEDSRDSVKVALGLIVTLTALILGLMVNSAKSSFDSKREQLTEIASEVVALDRVLAAYGPDAAPIRAIIKTGLEQRINALWPSDGSNVRPDAALANFRGLDIVQLQIIQLPASTQVEHLAQGQAIQICAKIVETRGLLTTQATQSSIGPGFFAVLMAWLAIVFVVFSLLTPRNTTAIASLVLCAAVVSCAIVLVFELDSAYTGFIKLPKEALVNALAQLGQ